MLTLTRCAVYFLVTVTIFLFLQDTTADIRLYRQVTHTQSNNAVRPRRAIGKPGFFWTLGSSIFQQFNETKSAYQQIRNLINDQFIDERKSVRNKAATTTKAPEPDATTTQEPYRVSRNEFNSILMRNLRGLVRLYNLELADALKQSEQNRADFNKQLRVSIKKELS